MRWKRTQMSAWMYSIRWPRWNGALAYGSAVVTKSLRGIGGWPWVGKPSILGIALRESCRRCASRSGREETTTMVRRVGAAVLAAVAIGSALLVANFVLSVHHTRQLRDESAAVVGSSELLLALDNVLSLAVDAETGQRGYVITGRDEYLAPYRAAVASIHRQMDALEKLTEPDPVQRRLMADVRRQVGAKLGELDLTIALRDRNGFDATRDVILLGAGEAEMQALRKTAAEMAAHETRKLAEREAAARQTYRAAIAGEAISGLAAIAALVCFSLLLARHLRSRDRNEQTIRE